jgi:hypothetical protein
LRTGHNARIWAAFVGGFFSRSARQVSAQESKISAVLGQRRPVVEHREKPITRALLKGRLSFRCMEFTRDAFCTFCIPVGMHANLARILPPNPSRIAFGRLI